MNFPERQEYTDYYHNYVQLLPEANPLELLQQTHDFVMNILKAIDADLYDYRYAADKWTIKQLLLHLLDCEQILMYRALRFARNDCQDALPFSEDDYAAVANTDKLDKAYLLKSLELMRANTIHLFKGFSNAELIRGGSPVFANSVRAIAAIIAGHELHHIYVLQERYLKTSVKRFKR